MSDGARRASFAAAVIFSSTIVRALIVGDSVIETGYRMPMHRCQSTKLPKIWLMSDPRFGERLFPSIQKLPIGSGVILRHYDDPKRLQIAQRISRLCRKRGHILLIGGDQMNVHSDGIYWSRPPKRIDKARKMLNIISVHNAA